MIRVLIGNDVVINWYITEEVDGVKTPIDLTGITPNVYIITPYDRQPAAYIINKNVIKIFIPGTEQFSGVIDLDASWQVKEGTAEPRNHRVRLDRVIHFVNTPPRASFDEEFSDCEGSTLCTETITTELCSNVVIGGIYDIDLSTVYTKSQVDELLKDITGGVNINIKEINDKIIDIHNSLTQINSSITQINGTILDYGTRITSLETGLTALTNKVANLKLVSSLGELTNVTSVADVVQTKDMILGIKAGAIQWTLFDSLTSEFTDITVSNSIKLGNGQLKWDEANQAFYVIHKDGKTAVGLYTYGGLSALGISGDINGGGTGGGLIKTVYDSSKFGSTFTNTNLTETFNAHAINSLYTRIVSLESGSATTITTTGTGNVITALSKSGNTITATKGITAIVAADLDPINLRITNHINDTNIHLTKDEKTFITEIYKYLGYDSTNKAVYVKKHSDGTATNFYTFGGSTALGTSDMSGGTTGGLIQTVYGVNDFGKTFSSTTYTDTFNAHAINSLYGRIVTLEGGSTLSIAVTGTGNAVTNISKSGTVITATKSITFATLAELTTAIAGIDLSNFVTLNTAQTISAIKTFIASPVLANNVILSAKNSIGTNLALAYISSANYTIFGNTSNTTNIYSNASNLIHYRGTDSYTIFDTYNYQSIIDSRYVLKAGDTMTGALITTGLTVTGGASIAGSAAIAGALKVSAGLEVTGSTILNGLTHITGTNHLRIGDGSLRWDSTNNALYVVKADGSTAINFYATGGVTALGASSIGGGGSGGLITSVLGSSGFGGTYSDTVLTNTFNAYAINSLYTRIVTAETKITTLEGQVGTVGDLSGTYVTLATSQNITGNKTFTSTNTFSAHQVITNSVYLHGKSIGGGNYPLVGIDASNVANFGSSLLIARINTNSGYNVLHGKGGTDYVMWDASNSNLSTVSWSMLNATVAGTIKSANAVYIGESTGQASGLAGVVIQPSGSIEIVGNTPYIDFHYGLSTSDYTSRIVESASGILTVTNSLTTGANLKVGGTLSVTGTSTLTGAVTMGSSLTVTGSIVGKVGIYSHGKVAAYDGVAGLVVEAGNLFLTSASNPAIYFSINNATGYTSYLIADASSIYINKPLRGSANNGVTLGTSAYYWSNAYVTDYIGSTLTLSGAATLTGNTTIGGTLRVTGVATIIGDIISNAGLVTPYVAGTWLSMATRTTLLRGNIVQSASSAHALYKVTTNSNNVVSFGGLGDTVGFYGFYANTISAGTNTTNWYTVWNTNTGTLSHAASVSIGGILTVSDTTDATSAATGSIKALGGIGVAKAIWAGTNITAAGNILAYGGVTALSDNRLKDNPREFDAIELITKLKPVRYTWNGLAVALTAKLDTHTTQYGLLAQDVEKVLPDFVSKHGEYLTIDYTKFVPILIGAIQIHNITLSRHEVEIKNLKSKIEMLENKVEQLKQQRV